MNRCPIFLMAIVAIMLINIVNGDINCNDQGVCTGDGNPSADVRCGDCHSCTYKNCCHVRFTNVNTYCNIPGWRSDAYKHRWNE